MKSVVAMLFLMLSVSAHAMTEAESLYSANVSSYVFVPGYQPGVVDLAASIEFSSPCTASLQTVMSNQEANSLSVFTMYHIKDLACPAIYSPVNKWVVVAKNLNVGEKIVLNGSSSLVVKAPTPAICTQDLCSDGSSRDSFTCACPSDYK